MLLALDGLLQLPPLSQSWGTSNSVHVSKTSKISPPSILHALNHDPFASFPLKLKIDIRLRMIHTSFSYSISSTEQSELPVSVGGACQEVRGHVVLSVWIQTHDMIQMSVHLDSRTPGPWVIRCEKPAAWDPKPAVKTAKAGR